MVGSVLIAQDLGMARCVPWCSIYTVCCFVASLEHPFNDTILITGVLLSTPDIDLCPPHNQRVLTEADQADTQTRLFRLPSLDPAAGKVPYDRLIFMSICLRRHHLGGGPDHWEINRGLISCCRILAHAVVQFKSGQDSVTQLAMNR